MEKCVIIVAGGTGTRMGSMVPKQFLLLNGLPVLMHTIAGFRNALPHSGITVALPADQSARWESLVKEHGFDVQHKVVAGGESRFHSVRNALRTLPPEGLVAIHDGVRPVISAELIIRLFTEAEKFGNAVPAVAVKESVRETLGNESRPVDRSTFVFVQTPQVFRLEEAHSAYRQEFRPEFTDDATVLEAAGFAIHLAEGDPSNIKITSPGDMVIAQALMTRPFQR